MLRLGEGLEVVPGQNWYSELGSLIICDFQTQINKPEINIILNVVENIPRMLSGKHLPLISHWMRSLQSESVRSEEELSPLPVIQAVPSCGSTLIDTLLSF